ncbi:uncharacterized protein CMC5_024110 [Chondromyces crocatus]|uniref:RNA polymerase sigma factor 70 region 4 type 2 domain-containing protein n=1 Tax=Chondromyces crocatus TaxID=52 RepID=A0A0K1ECG5_CHOCO|nr:uncharacterized protein CMC5_024110 [Chondromyces crocatus]
MLARYGVRPPDRADLLQDVLFAAWLRISSGEFRPDPAASPSLALRGWIKRIAFHKATHWQDLAWSRLTELAPLDPRDLLPGYLLHPEPYLEARELLAVVRRLNRFERVALLAHASGHSLEEIGAELHVSVALVSYHLDLGREDLAVLTGGEASL